MKKIIAIFLLGFIMVGCSTSTNSDEEEVRYVFEVNRHSIEIGEDATQFILALGEYNHQSSAPSCAFDGEDTVYDYPSYQITTYKNNNQETLTGVYLLDDTIKTKEGIHIGSSLDDVVAAYGEDYVEQYGVITYTKHKTELSFVLMNDVVTSISYIHVVNE